MSKKNGWGAAREGKVSGDTTQTFGGYSKSNVKPSSIKDGMYKQYKGKKGTTTK